MEKTNQYQGSRADRFLALYGGNTRRNRATDIIIIIRCIHFCANFEVSAGTYSTGQWVVNSIPITTTLKQHNNVIGLSNTLLATTETEKYNVETVLLVCCVFLVHCHTTMSPVYPLFSMPTMFFLFSSLVLLQSLRHLSPISSILRPPSPNAQRFTY